MKKVLLSEFNSSEIKELLKNEVTAITCFGSCESHGWHCCLGPDFYVPQEVAVRAARKLNHVVVAPAVPYGVSIHYNEFPLSITLKYETMIAVAEEVFESLIHHGIKRIFILNGHDGNIPALEIAARNVKMRHTDAIFLYMPAWWEKVGPLMGEKLEVWNGLGHGGEGETSIMMAVRPDLVDLSKAVSQVPETMIEINKDIDVIWNISEITKTGATGDPTKASIEKGNQMLDILVELVVCAIQKMDRRDWKY